MNRCTRLCAMNDPDKGCLLGLGDNCTVGPDKEYQRPAEVESNIVREKLVELINNAIEWAGTFDATGNYYCLNFGVVADVLIANGVTVQEWIPASEPPETNGCYLVAGNLRWAGKPMVREAYWLGDAWLSCDGKFYITRRITHWMPLPTPPKGE